MTIHLKTVLPPPLWLPTRTAGPRRACGRYRGKPDLPRARSLFGIAPGGACRAGAVASPAVGSYPTVSPLLACKARKRSVFCGAFPRVAPAGRYPAPLSCGVRTFLPGGSASAKAVIRPSALAPVKRPALPGQRESVLQYRPAQPYPAPPAVPAPRGASAAELPPEYRHR